MPGTEGDFTVLVGHAPVISTIRPGVIAVSLSDSRTVRLFVKGGFAEVEQNRLTVLAQRALEVDALDAARIATELKTAEGELAAATDDAARLAAHAAVDQLARCSPERSACCSARRPRSPRRIELGARRG